MRGGMSTAVLLLLLLLLLIPGKGRAKRQEKSSSRPWYDARYRDVIEYDIFGDDD